MIALAPPMNGEEIPDFSGECCDRFDEALSNEYIRLGIMAPL
jgi:hypothetical protein